MENEEDESMQLEKTVRIFPHKMQGEGHFLALFEKEKDMPVDVHATSKKAAVKLPDELKGFLQHVSYHIDEKDIVIRDNKAYIISPNMPDESGLRIMRNGTLLGEVKKNRFEPSQAFAMVLKASEYDKVINLSVDDERVIKYLKGETIDAADFKDNEAGWSLICVDGYPLGWGKFNGSMIKNKYLAGWRWQ